MEINFGDTNSWFDDWTDPSEWEKKMSSNPGQKWSFKVYGESDFSALEVLVLAYALWFEKILLN